MLGRGWWRRLWLSWRCRVGPWGHPLKTRVSQCCCCICCQTFTQQQGTGLRARTRRQPSQCALFGRPGLFCAASPPLYVRASAPAAAACDRWPRLTLPCQQRDGFERGSVCYLYLVHLTLSAWHTMLDGDDYLQEGFDPRGVTMPRLRSILVTHNVDYPSTAKKPQLVQLVSDHVLSQAPKLRAERARAKRSSYGIVNAGSANDAHTWDDQELLPPPSALRRSRSPRKSSAKSRAEGQDVNAEPPLLSPRKRNSRSTSRQVSRADDEDVPSADLARSARRSRRTMTPQIKVESDEEGEKDELHLPQENASVFTDDNPFQSGSSPPAAKPPAYRRPTADDDLFKSVKTPTGRTEGRAHQIRASRSFALSTPLPRSESPEEPLEPGEEFTPGEQLELERAAREGEIHIAERKPAPEVARRTSLKTPLLVLFLALISAYGAWYRQEKIAVGYCGLGRPAKTLLPPELPLPDVLVSLVEPQCEQCPPHAYCYQDFSVRCEADFILEPHPLSLGGLVPFPPSCEPDGEKARRVHAVADKAVEELRERRAKFECGDLVDQTGQPQDSPAITGEDLKESVSKRRNKRLSRQEFDELWTAAIGEVATRDEVQSTEDENAG